MGGTRGDATAPDASPLLFVAPTPAATTKGDPVKLPFSRRVALGIGLVAVTAVAAVVAAIVATSGSSKTSSNAAPSARTQVCALLPDTTTSTRYVLFDAPDLSKAFKAAGLRSSVLNAHGSTTAQISQAQQCITNGAKVILVDALDSGTGAAIESSAASSGVKTIDYDRLVLHGKASYYVSFDNVRVGRLLGTGLVEALKANGMYSKHPVVAELNGSPTDNNATLFAQGYNSVLDPLYKNGTFVKGPNQSVTGWSPPIALTDFEGMLARTNNKIDAVLAANDAIAGSVVSALKSARLKPIPLTGQDATPGGIQFILAGLQSGTVYKSVPAEAKAAAQIAIDIIKGKTVRTNGTTSNGARKVPSVLLTPVWVTKKNYTLLFKQGFLKKSQVCVGVYARLCA
jgi:D-xylose transport system substrate-binding protein